MENVEQSLKTGGIMEGKASVLDDGKVSEEFNEGGSCQVFLEKEVQSYIYCEEHPNAVVIDDVSNFQKLCSTCATVISDVAIDSGAEWRTTGSSGNKFNNEQSRCGYADNGYVQGSELVTDYQEKKKPVRGKRLRGQAPEYGDDRTFRHTIINQVSKHLQIPADVRREAKNIMQKCLMKRSTDYPFKPDKHLEGACLYVASRIHTNAVTQTQLLDYLRKEKKIRVGKFQRLIIRAQDLDLKCIEPQDFVSSYCEELELPEFVSDCAAHIATEVQREGVTDGKNPRAIAAAAVYLASHAAGPTFARTKKELAGVSHISMTAIGAVYKIMDRNNESVKFFPPGFRFGIALVELPLS